LQPADVFAFGVGLDIAGGYLVAKGLLIPPNAILRRSINDEHYFIPEETAALIEDRVNGRIGLLGLLAGFAVQAVGYALTAGTVSGAITTNSGIARGGVAVVSAAAGAVVVLGLWRMLYWTLVRQLVVYVARDPLQLGHNYLLEVGELAAPSASRLERLGEIFGHLRDPSEESAAYAIRVFGVAEVSENDLLATAFHPARLV
jgi:hypothetical protein